MIKLLKDNNAGFTLIELIITMAIFVIVLVVVTNFFIFNLNTYEKGEELSAVQFDVRMASEYITKELRNVNDISDTNNTLDEELNISILSTNYPSVQSVVFEITYEGPRYFVDYTVTGNSPDGSNSYSIETKVLLNNIESATIATSNTLYYTK